jgi:hypothetical protein
VLQADEAGKFVEGVHDHALGHHLRRGRKKRGRVKRIKKKKNEKYARKRSKKCSNRARQSNTPASLCIEK